MRSSIDRRFPGTRISTMRAKHLRSALLPAILLALAVAGLGCRSESVDREPGTEQPPSQQPGTTEPSEEARNRRPSATEEYLLADSSMDSQAEAPFIPSSLDEADVMLELAGVDASDVVYDLGSGDGRIPIRASRVFGARAVGIEIDGELVRTARRHARSAGVADRVEFREQDVFEADLSGATVVTLYLLPSMNVRLRLKLLRELPAGTPIVSNVFGMGAWDPDSTIQNDSVHVHLWRVPEDVPPRLLETPDTTAQSEVPARR